VKVVISYVLSLVGLGFVVAAVIGAITINLGYPGARLRMMNMLRTSVNQAEIACRAAKHTFYEPIGAAIKIAAMAGTQDLAVLSATTKPGYDAACLAVKMHWMKLFGRGKLGVMMVVGALALVMSTKASPILHIIVAVIAAIAAIWFWVVRNENERSLTLARAELLPELDRAFAEGRYVRPG